MILAFDLVLITINCADTAWKTLLLHEIWRVMLHNYAPLQPGGCVGKTGSILWGPFFVSFADLSGWVAD